MVFLMRDFGLKIGAELQTILRNMTLSYWWDSGVLSIFKSKKKIDKTILQEN